MWAWPHSPLSVRSLTPPVRTRTRTGVLRALNTHDGARKAQVILSILPLVTGGKRSVSPDPERLRELPHVCGPSSGQRAQEIIITALTCHRWALGLSCSKPPGPEAEESSRQGQHTSSYVGKTRHGWNAMDTIFSYCSEGFWLRRGPHGPREEHTYEFRGPPWFLICQTKAGCVGR